MKLLITEMFNVKIGFASNIMKEIFEIDNRNYNFRRDFLIERHNVESLYYGNETASSIGLKMLTLYLMAAKMQPR